MSFGLPGSGASPVSGRAVIVATATPGTELHAAGALRDQMIRIRCCNTHSAAVKVTLEWGGATSPDDVITYSITNDTGDVVVAEWTRLPRGLAVSAFAAVASVVTAYVEVRDLPSTGG